MIMYAGKVVEAGQTRQIIDNPGHPYTYGLLAALPQRAKRGRTLNQIPGTMPGIADLPTGCAYHPRCERAYAGCQVNVPPLDPHEQRRIACFRPLIGEVKT
jgi:peptide/nickel transport system ATP-binding protein